MTLEEQVKEIFGEDGWETIVLNAFNLAMVEADIKNYGSNSEERTELCNWRRYQLLEEYLESYKRTSDKNVVYHSESYFRDLLAKR